LICFHLFYRSNILEVVVDDKLCYYGSTNSATAIEWSFSPKLDEDEEDQLPTNQKSDQVFTIQSSSKFAPALHPKPAPKNPLLAKINRDQEIRKNLQSELMMIGCELFKYFVEKMRERMDKIQTENEILKPATVEVDKQKDAGKSIVLKKVVSIK